MPCYCLTGNGCIGCDNAVYRGIGKRVCYGEKIVITHIGRNLNDQWDALFVDCIELKALLTKARHQSLQCFSKLELS